MKTLSHDIEQLACSYLETLRKSGRTYLSPSLPPANPADYPEAVWQEMTRAQQ
ncbi:MAG TPA: hypothetical protein VGL24_02380 [Chthoniobacterales bacterium]